MTETFEGALLVADLRIDYDLLSGSQGSLERIHRELVVMGGEHEDRRLWGSSLIADRMAEVVGNWSFHRGKLSEAVEATGSMVQAALDGFRSADRELSRVFDAKPTAK